MRLFLRYVMLLGTLALLLRTENLQAQAAPLEGARTDPLTPPPASVTTPELEAQALYRIALVLIGQEKFDQARPVLERLIRSYPDSEWVDDAKRWLEDMAAMDKSPQPARASEALANSGRAEFVVFQTLMSTYVGIAIPTITEADNEKFFIVGPMLAALGGLGASLAISNEHPLTSSQAALINYSQFFGGFNLALWDIAIRGDDMGEWEAMTFSLLGLGIGSVVGGMAADRFDIPEGRVSLMSTTGMWSTILSELILLSIFEDDINGRVYATAAPLMADIGIAASARLAAQHHFQISRSRVRLINLGGFVGGLVGFGLSAIIEVDTGRQVAALALLGSCAGLGASVSATKDWDQRYHPELFARNPTPSFLTLEGKKLRFGEPMPVLTMVRAPTVAGTPGKVSPAIGVNFFAGTF